MKRLLIACLLGAVVGLGLVGVARAAIDTYEFKDEVERERFRSLTEELRCPKCQNQNIADSNAPIATDLRREIYRMLDDGRSDKEIVDFLVMRYGDFVMYKPPLDSRTWLLWYGPFGLLGLVDERGGGVFGGVGGLAGGEWRRCLPKRQCGKVVQLAAGFNWNLTPK